MGFFSFLGKKNHRDVSPISEIDAPRRKRGAPVTRVNSTITAERIANSQGVQRDAARKTALKIDAIESEMSYELTRPPGTMSGAQIAPTLQPPENLGNIPTGAGKASKQPPDDEFLETLPGLAMSTDFMLGGDVGLHKIGLPLSETAPIIEEAAILFANDQNEIVESMLLDAIEEDHAGEASQTVWAMLFDLYQIIGRQEAFEKLAAAYASKFERSPPTWITFAQGESDSVAVTQSARKPIALSGNLDASIQKQLERIRNLSVGQGQIQLDFTRLAAITTEGCKMLLETLKELQQAGCSIGLTHARELSDRVRATCEIGRRGDTEVAWLLLLELLQLQDRQQDFEDASIDYCVTFEVSPPAFVDRPALPAVTVTPTQDDVFLMPVLVDGKSDLINDITLFAARHNPAIIDCKHLARVDFSAAGQLLSCLAPLVGDDRVIELHNVNQLVTALFNVMGLREIARIIPRKE
ncbi:MAG: ABC-type transporter Mla MlaB component [Burkholderiaceae bacterium]